MKLKVAYVHDIVGIEASQQADSIIIVFLQFLERRLGDRYLNKKSYGVQAHYMAHTIYVQCIHTTWFYYWRPLI